MTSRTVLLWIPAAAVLVAMVVWLVLALAAPGAEAQQGPPGTVDSVNVSRTNGKVTAEWNDVSGATKYHVTYSTDGGGSWELAAYEHTETILTISGADNSATYIIGVRAGNDHGWGGWKNSEPADPHVLSPPGTTSSISITRADGTVTATWDAVNEATTYHITYTTDAGKNWHLAAYDHAETTVTVSGADNSKAYVVGVRAGNDAGWGGWKNSAPAGPYTPEPTATPTPTPTPTATPTPTPTPAPVPVACNESESSNQYYICLKSVVAGDGLLTFNWSWTRPPDFHDIPQRGFVHYEFQQRKPNGEYSAFVYVDSGGVLRQRIETDEDDRSYTIPGLTNGQVYNVRIAAHYYRTSGEGYVFVTSNENLSGTPEAPPPTPTPTPSPTPTPTPTATATPTPTPTPAPTATPTPTATPEPGTDYDVDNDGLIEITSIPQIAVLVYDANADGVSTKNGTDLYAAAFPDAQDGMGCPESGCIGYELTSDMAFDSETSWEYIVYDGIFEGNGYTLSNLYSYQPDSSRVGLIGLLHRQGVIRNLTLTSVDVTGRWTVGGLVGSNLGLIENVSVDGRVAASYGNNTGRIGGLAGTNEGTINRPALGTIRNASFRGTVDGGIYTGGLVGHNMSATIVNSTVNATVTGRDYVGGLAGDSAGKVDNVTVTATVTGNLYVGGLIGDNTSIVSNGSVDVDVSGFLYVGGLVGQNLGTITASSSEGTVTSDHDAGGLAGYNWGVISGTSSSATVIGGHDSGGLVGWNQRDGIITESGSVGSVTGRTYIGGLVGRNEGVVSRSSSNAAVRGDWHSGGLVGYNSDFTSTGKGSISSSSSSGDVVGGWNMGGLVGLHGYGSSTTDSNASGDVIGFTAGALTGPNPDGTITNSYGTGTVTIVPGLAEIEVTSTGLLSWEYQLATGVTIDSIVVRWIEKPDDGAPINWSNAFSEDLGGSTTQSGYQLAGLDAGERYAVKLFIDLDDNGVDRQIEAETVEFTAVDSM